MKKFIITMTALIAIPCSLWAQSITANSTAEECIEYIDKIAKKNLSSLYESVDFNGTSFLVMHSDRHATQHQYINWASFSRLDMDASHQYMMPSVSFVFKDSVLRMTEMINQKQEVVFRDFHTASGFAINAWKDEFPFLEIAAKRLLQLAKAGQNSKLEVRVPPEGIRPFKNVLETKTLIKKQINAFRSKEKYAGGDLGFELTPDKDSGKFKMNTRWNERTKAPEESIELAYKDMRTIMMLDGTIYLVGNANTTDIKSGKKVPQPLESDKIAGLTFVVGDHVSLDEILDLVDNLNHWLWLQGIKLE